MEDPYQRAICLKLLTLVAENITLKFSKFEHETQTISSTIPTIVPIPIRQSVYKVPFESLSLHDQILIRNLETVITAAEDIKKATELFRKFDTDNSGALDFHELNVLVKHFSPAIEEAALQEVFLSFFKFNFYYDYFNALVN